MKTFTVAGFLITLAALGASGAGSSPTGFAGRNGRIVFASERPIPGQARANAGNGDIYSLELAGGRSHDLSRSTDDDRAPAFSPDGTRIAFVRTSFRARRALWLMRRDGRAQRRLVDSRVAGDIEEIAWSPDGTTLGFSTLTQPASWALWIVHADGSGLRRLTDFRATELRYSPDGTEIAFAGREREVAEIPSHIGTVGADGRGLRWLTPPDGWGDDQPAWSPDGKQLVFVRRSGAHCCFGPNNLFVIGADGSGERQLTSYGIDPGERVPGSPAWSPSGREIVFARGGTDAELDLIRPDSTGLRMFARHGFAPAWSPAGERLAFAQHRKNGGLELVVKPLGGPARRRHLEPGPSDLLGGPSWSPDGKSLLYASAFAGRNDLELFSIAPDGRRLRQLTRNSADDFDPAWSRDGRRIVFARGRIDETDGTRVRRSSLYVMDASGRHTRRLTRGGLDTAPSWAPSGKRIVFSRGDLLELLDHRTGRVHSLTSGTDPVWSPDGRLIAFANGPELEAIRPNGRRERTLFDGGVKDDVPAQISHPSWSPDGRSIAFHLLYDNYIWSTASDVIVSRTGQSRRTRLCRLPALTFNLEGEHPGRPAWSPDGHWVAVSGVGLCRIDGSAGYWLTPGEEPDWKGRIHR